MAQSILEVIINAKDNATSQLKGLSSSLSNIAIGAGAVGTAITGALGASVKAAMDAEVAQNRFETVMKNVSKATDEQVAALREQQSALQASTRFEGEAIASAQGFLGTFALSTKEIQKLTPHLLDMAEGMRKATGGTMDLEQGSNMLGKAIATGSLGALQKVGVTIPGATQAMQELYMKQFELANQSERVAMVTQLMDGNFKGLAVSAGQTLAGQLDIAKNQFGDIMETIGGALLPILTDLASKLQPIIASMAQWMEANPQLTQNLVMLAAVLGPLLVILPLLVGAITALLSPIGLVIAAIVALIAIGVALYTNWDEIKKKAGEVWGSIVESIRGALAAIGIDLDKAVAAFKMVFDAWWASTKATFDIFINLFKGDWKAALDSFIASITAWAPVFSGAMDAVWGSVKAGAVAAWEGIKNIILSGINWVIDKINSAIASIESTVNAAGSAIGAPALKLGRIPALAEGGVVTKPTLALIGEAGPEAVVPLSKLNQVGGGGGNMNVEIMSGATITVTNQADEKRLAQTISQELARVIQTQNAGLASTL